MVGIGTVMADDPLLTSRLPGEKTKDPVRVIVDTKLRISSKAKVIKHRSSAKTILAVGPKIPQKRLESIESTGASVITCPLKKGLIDLPVLFQRLGAMSLNSVLVEGGSSITGSLIRERLVDKFYIFKAPKILGGEDGFPLASGPGVKRMDKCLSLREIKISRFEEDILIEGYPVYK
jgi:diaminohydroxyphosphoribosylaminopyrimidine deaminase/5-amino-6-(5-phosphoribosylamino)uracil reductase